MAISQFWKIWRKNTRDFATFFFQMQNNFRNELRERATKETAISEN